MFENPGVLSLVLIRERSSLMIPPFLFTPFDLGLNLDWYKKNRSDLRFQFCIILFFVCIAVLETIN
jgi:hypothetical protein